MRPFMFGDDNLEDPVELSFKFKTQLWVLIDGETDTCVPSKVVTCNAGKMTLENWSQQNFYKLGKALEECKEDISEQILSQYFL